MKKKINLSLYKSLIYCDFFLIKYDLYTNSLRNKSLIKNFYLYTIINLLESVKNFKNLINIIKFILKKQFSNILLQVENSICLAFINSFFKYFPTYKYFLYLTPFFKNFKSIQAANNFELNKNYFYCILGSSLHLKNSIVSYLIKNESYLISQFKLSFNINESGFYKIKMDINDFKKIIFLMIFLNKIISYYVKILFNQYKTKKK